MAGSSGTLKWIANGLDAAASAFSTGSSEPGPAWADADEPVASATALTAGTHGAGRVKSDSFMKGGLLVEKYTEEGCTQRSKTPAPRECTLRWFVCVRVQLSCIFMLRNCPGTEPGSSAKASQKQHKRNPKVNSGQSKGHMGRGRYTLRQTVTSAFTRRCQVACGK
jgi:hypothetical protein